MREERLRLRNSNSPFFAVSVFIFSFAFLIAIAIVAPERSQAQEYAIGADVSFAPQAEQEGIVFKDHGVPAPVLEMLKSHGYNWIRLRIFYAPTDLPNNLDYTIASGKAAKKLGFHFLLDFHYSDTWADPAKQFTPKAWIGLMHDQLVKEVFAYTRDTIAAFRSANVLPDVVQVGNEITNGMLWPDGRLPDHWDHFADLVKAGIAGVAAGAGDSPHPRIMIHIEKSGDQPATKYFFDNLNSYHVPYDVIGQSYYPWWHGSLKDLQSNLRFMAKKYKKDIFVVETAYNWKPTEYLAKPAPFPETPAGQKMFLEEVNRVLRKTPHGLGKGIFWWEPAVPPGSLTSRSFFNDNSDALPVITVFDSATQ
jgi:arabinogalactan endo-1,4-beta-galactosidase